MTEEVVLMKGNEAIAHAAIRLGVDGYFARRTEALGDNGYGSPSSRKRSSSY